MSKNIPAFCEFTPLLALFALPLAPILSDISLPFSTFSHVRLPCKTPCFRAIFLPMPALDLDEPDSARNVGLALYTELSSFLFQHGFHV